jgi:hypothetical protein
LVSWSNIRRVAHDDIEPKAASIGGWFCIKPYDFNELWNQIRQGGYAECWISLEVGPLGVSRARLGLGRSSAAWPIRHFVYN